MFDRLAKVGVLVVAVGTDGGINCSANVRDHGDINIAIKRLHRGLMKSCYESLFLKKKKNFIITCSRASPTSMEIIAGPNVETVGAFPSSCQVI